MILNKKPADFIATEVPLDSRNLIEASAGTGKTYSIAILVLRLILEKKISIKDILMVTFTKAAVAELEERIRLFVRTAYKFANNKSIEDQSIKYLVNRAIQESDQEKVKQLLKEAKLLLDETSVMTIHSFCQQTLNEFAFETNQLFGSETLQDTTSLIQNEVNNFWRKQITILDPALLNFLLSNGLERNLIVRIIGQTLDGQRFIAYNPELSYAFSIEQQQKAIEELLEAEKTANDFLDNLYQEILNSVSLLTEICNSNRYAKTGVLPYICEPEKFIQALKDKIKSGYITELFSDWLEKIAIADEYQSEIKTIANKTNTLLYNIAIQNAIQNIVDYKGKNSMLSFNDMIVQLHKALTKSDNEKLVLELKKKYKAVFIDEFQDTDKFQYEIFKNAFKDETILFYIGDPKQSIYAWRQADLKTYFKASHEVDNVYGMNQNYRSTEKFIQAMNVFFEPVKNFDTFNFLGEEDGIKYIPVESSQPNNKGILLKEKIEDIPITIFENTSKEEIAQTVAAQIIELLKKDNYRITKNREGRAIKPSDIGVLVRSKYESQTIKAELAKYGIPAITIDESKVLQSSEAKYLLYLLNAFNESTTSNINKALLGPLTGFSRNEILKLDSVIKQDRFKNYGREWQEAGIYATLMKFIVDYNVKDNLIGNGERSITNLFQLIEILHKVQASKQLSPLELINWLKRGEEGMKMEGDEFEQRIESDMDAIEIVTIHKSKGLEYNIVFAPYLDLKAELRKPFCSFKDDITEEYLFGYTDDLESQKSEIALRQLEQEDRRLVYVAITRAVYKCYINRNYRSNDTALSAFTEKLKENLYPSNLIEFSGPLEAKDGYRFTGSKEKVFSQPATTANFKLKEEYWRKMSYSSLAKSPIYTPKSNIFNDLEEYEYFIFKLLIKGNITGNLLHHLFENIDFVDNQFWEKQIHSALSRFMPKQIENYKTHLNQLVEEVLNVKIKTENTIFKLSDVSKEKRLNELEFDFNVPSFNTNVLNNLSNSDYQFVINAYGELEGIMNGKMDLFFEHQGLYYILDWKSNFLGDSLSDYTKENLNAAMTANNYHLQYLIYTLAAKKYLEGRLSTFNYNRDFGGVIYIFIRGVRQNSDHGVFVCKPQLAKIRELETILTYQHSIK